MSVDHLRRFQYRPIPKPTHGGFWLCAVPIVAMLILLLWAPAWRVACS